ncbi:MAG: leucine-rich repeat domain-containing protein, partial [Nanoarchaeota archaeon]|nr:leucine-rich repeat domain-containing protein [Nanoarchaeota archaeon]
MIILCIHSNGQGTYDVFYSVDDALESRSQYIELDLSNQGLVHLPQRVFQIVNLRSINLSNNPLLDVSTSLDSLNQFQYLETIKLNNLNLKYFPFELYGLTKLKYLHIEKNQIETLPDEIKSMYSLKGLYVNDNKIDYIQPGFMHLSKLEVIDLRQNGDYDSKSFLYFSSLMKSLKHLKIDCDKGLNEELVSLTNLKELTLYKPYIDKNYELFGSLNNLEELTIEKGVLVNYHQLFISMPESNLKKLSISDNAIVQLDDAIVNLKKLEYLSVS